MSDYVDEELERLSQTGMEATVLSGETFKQPIAKLFSKQAVSVDVAASVGSAVEVMRKFEYGAVCVTREGRLTGILTERDLLTKVIGVFDDALKMPVSDAMTPDPMALRAEDPIVYAMHNMHVGGYRHIPIVNDAGEPVSIVSIKDVVRFVLNYFPQEILNVPGEPYRGPRTRESG